MGLLDRFLMQDFDLHAGKGCQRTAFIVRIGAEGEGGVYRDFGLRQSGFGQYGVAQHTDMGHKASQHDTIIALGCQMLRQCQAAKGFLFPKAIPGMQCLGRAPI